jgi:predicted nucleic acid-binding protein
MWLVSSNSTSGEDVSRGVFATQTCSISRGCGFASTRIGEKFVWSTTVELAGRHRLTLYDAAYLELAMRQGFPLATLDRQLRSAAAIEHVVLLAE